MGGRVWFRFLVLAGVCWKTPCLASSLRCPPDFWPQLGSSLGISSAYLCSHQHQAAAGGPGPVGATANEPAPCLSQVFPLLAARPSHATILPSWHAASHRTSPLPAPALKSPSSSSFKLFSSEPSPGSPESTLKLAARCLPPQAQFPCNSPRMRGEINTAHGEHRNEEFQRGKDKAGETPPLPSAHYFVIISKAISQVQERFLLLFSLRIMPFSWHAFLFFYFLCMIENFVVLGVFHLLRAQKAN